MKKKTLQVKLKPESNIWRVHAERCHSRKSSKTVLTSRLPFSNYLHISQTMTMSSKLFLEISMIKLRGWCNWFSPIKYQFFFLSWQNVCKVFLSFSKKLRFKRLDFDIIKINAFISMMTSFKLKEALCWLNETRRILTLVKVSIPVKKAKQYFDEYRQLNYRKPAT